MIEVNSACNGERGNFTAVLDEVMGIEEFLVDSPCVKELGEAPKFAT